jgi:hypothetical protein
MMLMVEILFEGLEYASIQFFRNRIDAMINLNDPMAVLATPLPWDQIETAIAAKFEHQNRSGQTEKTLRQEGLL